MVTQPHRVKTFLKSFVYLTAGFEEKRLGTLDTKIG